MSLFGGHAIQYHAKRVTTYCRNPLFFVEPPSGLEPLTA